jgi:hypothetical protein
MFESNSLISSEKKSVKEWIKSNPRRHDRTFLLLQKPLVSWDILVHSLSEAILALRWPSKRNARLYDIYEEALVLEEQKSNF